VFPAVLFNEMDMAHPEHVEFSRFGAALFDLDGVVTKTAIVHAAAWKQLFDEFLKKESDAHHLPFVPFDREKDYRLYIDGKSRYDGVKSFLDSRGLFLPWGRPDDQPDRETIHGLGNRKDRYFDAEVRKTGVAVYPGTVAFLRYLKETGLRAAVVSSSHHRKDILEAAGLLARFEARIDGHEIDRLHLQGKPAPESFLEAVRRLQVHPREAIVIEDALAGVAAGRAGGFGLVIGVNRHDQAESLRRHGASLVVNDLTELLPVEAVEGCRS
jgi:beta-phosphoglucomutase family hydrolase